MTLKPKVVVVGGNGFIGSAICRIALARGMQVTSISSSGRPYQTPKGHTPSWTAQVDWKKGDAFKPDTFASHLDGASGVVHTLGILLEDAEYKRAVHDGNVPALLKAFFGGRNPLEPPSVTYESMNRDSALSVCETFIASKPPAEAEERARPFVFISAEDVFRPWVPARYIETKRATERGIAALVESQSTRFRGVYLRPGLVYHAHLRPLTTPAAAFLDLTAEIHGRLPDGIRSQLRAAVASLPPTSAETASPVASVANALTTRPLHLDHVAGSAVRACMDDDIHGVVDVRRMRDLMGWTEPELRVA